MNFEKLYKEQMKTVEELQKELNNSNLRNVNLKKELDLINGQVDEAIIAKLGVTKERVNEMIKFIDWMIEQEMQRTEQ